MEKNNLIKGTAILIGIAALAAFIVNALSPNGIALIGQWDTAAGIVSANPDQVNQLIEIDRVDIAKNIFDSGRTVFIDARSEDLYAEGHIKDAISLPVQDFFDRIDGFLSVYETSAPIVIYCSGRECSDSHELAEQFIAEGFSDVRVFIDGYEGWVKEGYPVER